MDGANTVGGSRPSTSRPESSATGSPGGRGGKAGSVYSVFLDEGGPAAEEVASDPHPITKWITVEENTRLPGQIEDRAAEYFIDQNLLMINGDFRVFTDMVARWQGFYGDLPSGENTVRDTVREWFEQTLIETVMGTLALRDGREWNQQDLTAALSKEALSAAVMPRYHVDIAIKRALGHRMGSLRDKVAV